MPVIGISQQQKAVLAVLAELSRRSIEDRVPTLGDKRAMQNKTPEERREGLMRAGMKGSVKKEGSQY